MKLALSYRWSHTDKRVDITTERRAHGPQWDQEKGSGRAEMFRRVWQLLPCDNVLATREMPVWQPRPDRLHHSISD